MSRPSLRREMGHGDMWDMPLGRKGGRGAFLAPLIYESFPRRELRISKQTGKIRRLYQPIPALKMVLFKNRYGISRPLCCLPRRETFCICHIYIYIIYIYIRIYFIYLENKRATQHISCASCIDSPCYSIPLTVAPTKDALFLGGLSFFCVILPGNRQNKMNFLRFR